MRGYAVGSSSIRLSFGVAHRFSSKPFPLVLVIQMNTNPCKSSNRVIRGLFGADTKILTKRRPRMTRV